MAGNKRKQTFDISGGQKATTISRGGPPVQFGAPQDAVLVHPAPFPVPVAGRRYIRQLFRRAIIRLVDLMDDDSLPADAPVASTLVYIAPDGKLMTAHSGAAQIIIFVRNAGTGAVRAIPLLKARPGGALRVQEHDLKSRTYRIDAADTIYICIQTQSACAAITPEAQAALLESFLYGRRGTAAQAAEYLSGCVAETGMTDPVTITCARLLPLRGEAMIMALFESDTAEGQRVAAGLVPVISGILDYDMKAAHIKKKRSFWPRPAI